MLILINNEFVEKKDSNINLFSDSVLFGFGLFETLRTYADKKLPFIDLHLARLKYSAQSIGLPLLYKESEIKEMVAKIVHRLDSKLQRIKIMLFQQKLIITSQPFEIDPEVYKGVELKSVKQRRSMPQIKSTSYLDCYLSYQKATKDGYYDALLVDENREVYECSRSNIFWKSENKLFTRKDDVLPGILRRVLIEMETPKVHFVKIDLDQLVQKDEVFITNSIIGIVPVTKIDDQIINSGKCGILTKKLKNKFDNYCTKIIE